MNGAAVPIHIVAVADTFPTLAGSDMIVDLPTLQSFLASHGGSPFSVTQWWLATDGAQVPPSLPAVLPPGAAVTSRDALTADAPGRPAVRRTAAGAARHGRGGGAARDHRLLGLHRRERPAAAGGERAARRARRGPAVRCGAAVPGEAAALRSIGRARPAARHGRRPAARPRGHADHDRAGPGPARLARCLDLSQTVPLAAAVALLPALAAALVVFRRPDPAAELRAAEAA